MAEEFSPRAAIVQFLKNELTGTQLLRGFASFRVWRVPARLENLIPVFNEIDLVGADGKEDRHFFLFSDKQAYLHCREILGIEAMGDYYLDHIAGFSAFDAIDDGVTAVNINPFSDNEIHYKKEQIKRLKTWSDIIRTELALDGVRAAKTGYDTIKMFSRYYFIMDDEKYIALAPDRRGRKLAALFTADDALQCFLERHGTPAMKPIAASGEKLFTAVKKMPLDGMVFNCSGPIKSRAFPLAFADAVLTQG